MVLLRGGRNPVLGHLFVNHMLDTEMAKLNFKQIGYQPPQNSLNGYARRRRAGPGEPQGALSCAPEYFDVGYRTLELDAANDAAWHNVWRAFKAGDPDGGGPAPPPGRRPHPTHRPAPPQQRVVARSGHAGHSLAAAVLPGAALRGAGHRVRPVDPIFRTPIPVWNPLQGIPISSPMF